MSQIDFGDDAACVNRGLPFWALNLEGIKASRCCSAFDINCHLIYEILQALEALRKEALGVMGTFPPCSLRTGLERTSPHLIWTRVFQFVLLQIHISDDRKAVPFINHSVFSWRVSSANANFTHPWKSSANASQCTLTPPSPAPHSHALTCSKQYLIA